MEKENQKSKTIMHYAFVRTTLFQKKFNLVKVQNGTAPSCTPFRLSLCKATFVHGYMASSSSLNR